MTDKEQEAAEERYKMMPHLKDACLKCRMCELGWSKAEGLDPHVFSNYHPLSGPAKFVIVGQNPGINEVKQGVPFVGAAGANFDKELFKTHWRREDFYISNAVKCFTEGNRVPSARQMERCEPFLRMELAILKPKLTIAFGAVAFSVLSDAVFSESIGKIVTSEKFGVKVFATYHPSPRNLIDGSRGARFERDMNMIDRILTYYLTPF